MSDRQERSGWRTGPDAPDRQNRPRSSGLWLLLVIGTGFGVFCAAIVFLEQKWFANRAIEVRGSQVLRMDEVARTPPFAIQVRRARWADEFEDVAGAKVHATETFLMADVGIGNEGGVPRTIYNFTLIDEDGMTYLQSLSGKRLGERWVGPMESISPHGDREGIVVFDVPRDHSYRLVIPSLHRDDSGISVQLKPTTRP
jgi:hypothetical protein